MTPPSRRLPFEVALVARPATYALIALAVACPTRPLEPATPTPVPPDAATADAAPLDAPIDAAPDAAAAADAAPDAPADAAWPPAIVPVVVDVDAPAPATPPRWLRGSTHVHAAPSGDSSTDPDEVVAWYRKRGYDFIVLTDHNRVTAIDPAATGRVSARPADGPLVIAGTELTYNPGACTDPAPPPGGKCRIHVNALGVVERPAGQLEWADRSARARRGMYAAAIARTRALGGIAQVNHPQWHWGMTGPLLADLARDGVAVVEVWNAAFATWSDGDADHPSVEALWDEALVAGATLYGVAADDAHSYDGKGRYPAGGAWIMVDAPRDADAIVAAIAGGRFYASTGVALAWAGPDRGALRVELAPGEKAATITFVVNGEVAATTRARAARHPIPATGYVRATVRRPDGARAWVQPLRR